MQQYIDPISATVYLHARPTWRSRLHTVCAVTHRCNERGKKCTSRHGAAEHRIEEIFSVRLLTLQLTTYTYADRRLQDV